MKFARITLLGLMILATGCNSSRLLTLEPLGGVDRSMMVGYALDNPYMCDILLVLDHENDGSASSDMIDKYASTNGSDEVVDFFECYDVESIVVKGNRIRIKSVPIGKEASYWDIWRRSEPSKVILFKYEGPQFRVENRCVISKREIIYPWNEDGKQLISHILDVN